MADPINTGDVLDFDQPINTDPDYSAIHVFSINDITGTYDGGTGTTYIDLGATPKIGKTNDGNIDLYPIDSEFGFNVTDFSGAEDKTIDGLYTEGWVGDLKIGGVQSGIVVSDAPTDTFKTPAVLGTWLSGLGGNSVKASTEHYNVMQHVLSDQKYAGDPDAVYQLDDDLTLLSQNTAWNNQKVSDLLANPGTFGVTDVNADGVLDIRDLMNANESTIEYDIAYGDDYSVTLKDDGKLLYRWGNMIKRPNDVRIEAKLDLPDEFDFNDSGSGLKQLFRITEAELVTHHTITNNPNDQIRPEDFENESAIGKLPTYVVDPAYNDDGLGVREVWKTTDPYYAGDGTLYEAGTILRDDLLASSKPGSLTNLSTSAMFDIGTSSADVEMGFTNAWYTTMDREPFEPELTGSDEYETGPRWRLLPDKYGQDLPSVTIPLDPSDPLPVTSGEEKYVVGAETQTVINLLDWESPTSPLEISAGWQNNTGTVSVNGLNMTDDFDVAFYIKGDIKPATLYSTELVMNYEAIDLHGVGTVVDGTAGSDFLVGINGNTFNGGSGEDLFVLSYAVSAAGPESVIASVVEDFTIGEDKLGLIGFDALAGFDVDSVADRSLIQQGVSGNDLTISVDGTLVATLTGVAAALGVDAGPTLGVDPGEGLDILSNFLITNPGEGSAPPAGSAFWSISGDTSVVEGGSADYIISLTGTLISGQTATIDIGLNDIDTDSADYADFVAAVNAAVDSRSDLAFDGTMLTYTGDGFPMTNLVVSLGAVDDGTAEGEEDYEVALSGPGGTGTVSLNTGSDSVITTISDIPDATPAEWSMTGDTSVEEGGSAAYTVSLTGTLLAGETATIDIGLNDIDTDSADYADFVAAVNAAIGARTDLSFAGSTLTYTGDGSAMTDLVINLGIIDDTLTEDAESYDVVLSNEGGTGAITLAAGSDVTTTIAASDQGPPPGAIVGTEGNDFLIGTPDGDIMFGLGGNDYIYGLAGNDIQYGGAGNDRLYGGAGSDQYVLAAGINVDTVYGFEDGTDKIRLEGLTFADVTIGSEGSYITVSADADSLRILNTTGISITIDDFAIA